MNPPLDGITHPRYKPQCCSLHLLSKYFRAIGFNLSNGVTDKLESSTILIYSDEHMSL